MAGGSQVTGSRNAKGKDGLDAGNLWAANEEAEIHQGMLGRPMKRDWYPL